MTHPSGWIHLLLIHLLPWLTELRETLSSFFFFFVKDIAKDTDDPSAGRGTQGKVRGRGVEPPCPPQPRPSPGTSWCSAIHRFRTLCPLGFFFSCFCFVLFFSDRGLPCRPGCSAVAPSQFIATSASWFEAIHLPQLPR